MKPYLYGPILRFWMGDLDLPDGRKRYTSSWVQEEVDTQTCPCGEAAGSVAYVVAGCELYEETSDV